eukprot:7390901-Prymnesium_polylepis.1
MYSRNEPDCVPYTLYITLTLSRAGCSALQLYSPRQYTAMQLSTVYNLYITPLEQTGNGARNTAATTATHVRTRDIETGASARIAPETRVAVCW